MAAGGGGPGQATSQGGTPPATTGAGAPPTTTGGGTAPASTGGGTATTAGATAGGRTTPDTDTIFQAQGTMQVGAPLYGGNRDFVPFTINASLGFPSHWGIQDWRYHQARRGAVAWWEHLDVLGAPVLGLGIGPSVGNEIHLQPSLTIALLQYHMTQGSGDAQLDNDFVVSTILQGDENLATGAFATGWLTQLAWVRTDASTSLFSLWVQGGVDLGTGAGSISAGVTMGLEHGFGGNAPRGD
jgi:hypothetical protein